MKSFTNHHLWQRITALMLLCLVPWFLWNLCKIKDSDYLAIVQNLNEPVTASLICLMICSGFYHGYLGIHTICLDYLASRRMRFYILLLSGLVFSFFSLLSIASLIRLGS